MARLRGHRNLNEDKPLYVGTRGLIADGRTFEAGAEFPWRELAGVTPRRLRLLHDQRKITHDPPERPMVGAEDPDRSPVEQDAATARDRGRAKAAAKAAQGQAKPTGVRGLG